MRRAVEKKGGKLSYEEAKETMQACIRLCYLRDCRSWPNYQLAKVDGNLRVLSLFWSCDSNIRVQARVALWRGRSSSTLTGTMPRE